MNRSHLPLLLFLVGVALFMVFTHARSDAMVEYCGADVRAVPVQSLNGSSSLYGLTLKADSERSVSGHLTFHGSDDSWYGVRLDSIGLTPRIEQYRNWAFAFSRTDYESQTIIVRFPQQVVVRSAFFDAIIVRNEHAMGWDSNEHTCAGIEPEAHETRRSRILEPLDAPSPQADLGAPIDAVRVSPPGATDCAVPFKDVSVKKVTAPYFPLGYRKIDVGYRTILNVAVRSDGTIADVWVFAPSGVAAFDQEAIVSARGATYSPARAFCQNVPAIYQFGAEFNPD